MKQNTLDIYCISQFGVELTDYIDVEFGTLCYMMKHRDDQTGNYLLYISDEKLRERINFLHDCRNNLAHATECTVEQVCGLLD